MYNVTRSTASLSNIDINYAGREPYNPISTNPIGMSPSADDGRSLTLSNTPSRMHSSTNDDLSSEERLGNLINTREVPKSTNSSTADAQPSHSLSLGMSSHTHFFDNWKPWTLDQPPRPPLSLQPILLSANSQSRHGFWEGFPKSDHSLIDSKGIYYSWLSIPGLIVFHRHLKTNGCAGSPGLIQPSAWLPLFHSASPLFGISFTFIYYLVFFLFHYSLWLFLHSRLTSYLYHILFAPKSRRSVNWLCMKALHLFL